MNTYLLIFLAGLVVYSAVWVILKYVFYEDERHSADKMWYVEPEPGMSVSTLALYLAYSHNPSYIFRLKWP